MPRSMLIRNFILMLLESVEQTVSNITTFSFDVSALIYMYMYGQTRLLCGRLGIHQ